MPLVSERLEALLALLTPCRMLVDVGTDHALVPILAVERGLAQRAIASDLRVAPLQGAFRNIALAGLESRVWPLRSAGLSALASNSVDAVVMAGMGGKQIVELCDAGESVLRGVSQLVLQPNSDAYDVRSWALRNGWRLRNERMLHERGQFFAVCAFEPGVGRDVAYDLPPFNEAALCLLGPRLLARTDQTLLRFAEWQCRRLGKLRDRNVAGLNAELEIWEAARAFMTS